MLGAKSNKENAKSYHERNKTHNIFIRLLFRLFLCSSSTVREKNEKKKF